MEMSETGRRLLTQWEGCRQNVYKDVAGLCTIGVGHLLTQGELASGNVSIQGRAVRYAKGLSDDEVQALLMQDLARYEAVVDEACAGLALEQNQFDALVSFCFNTGIGAFRQSSLLKSLQAGNLADVPDELRRWTRAGDREVPGLVQRRENEIKLWLGEI